MAETGSQQTLTTAKIVPKYNIRLLPQEISS